MANSSAYNAAPTLTSVEKVQVAELGSSTATVNLIYSTGVTEVANRLSGQNVTFSNLQQAATVTADGTTAGTTIATFKNTLANGTADAINLAVTNGATAAFQVGAVDQTNTFETLNIASNGATKNTISGITDNAGTPNNYGGVKSVVVTGAADLAIVLAGGATAASFDSTAGTGADTVTWGGNFTSIKTGAGNDIIDASAGSFFGSTAPKTVDGGAGSNTLIIAEAVSSLASNSTTGVLHSVANIGTVQQKSVLAAAGSDPNRTVDASLFPNSTMYAALSGGNTTTGTTNTATFSNLGAAQKVQASATVVSAASGTNTDKLTVSQKATSGAADQITVELISPNTNTTGTTPAANVLNTLTVGSGTDGGATETLNLIATNPSFVASGATTTTVGNTVSTITAQTTSNLVITGAGGLTIGTVDLKDPVGTGVQNIDASGMTGAFTLGSYGTAGVEDFAVSVKGGSGTNKYYFGTTIGSTDIITGGAGTDTLYVTDSSTAATRKPTATSVENLTVYTVSGGAKTFDVTSMTGLNAVSVAAVPVATGSATNAAYGTTLAGLNGQTVTFATGAAANSGSAADFASTTTNLRVATGVTNVTAQIKGDGSLFNNGTIATNAGQLTITDANTAATTGYYVDEAVTVAGTGLTGDAALTKVVITGGGLKSATATDVNKMTLAASATAGVTAITAVDATGWAGNLDISGAGLSSGATVTAGSGRNTITTSAAQLAVGALVIDGGDGSDTVAATALNSASYRPGLRNVETLDVTQAKLTGDVTLDLTDATGVTKIKLAGTTSTYASATATTGNAYSTTLSMVRDGTTVQLKSGASTNQASPAVTVQNGLANASGKALTITGATGATNLTVSNLDTLKVSTDAGNGLVVNTFTNVTLKQAASYDSTYGVLSLTDATSLTVGGQDASSTSGVAYAGAITATTVTASNLTSLTVDTTEGNVSIGSSGLTAAKLATVTASGAGNFTFGGSSATTTLLASFDASGLTGDVTIGQGVDFTTSASIKTGAGADTIWMNLQSYANVTVDAGTNTYSNTSVSSTAKDNLKLQGAMNMGLSVIDLSSTSDQITQANGAINGAVQKGFESVDGSALTGTYGLSITGSTGSNVIVGSGNADNIVGNGGADTITGGAGDDTIDITDAGTTSTASATIVFSAVASNGSDTITGFKSGATTSGGDALNVTGVATFSSLAIMDAGGSVSGTIQKTVADATTGNGGTGIGNKVVFLDVADYANTAAINTAIKTAATDGYFSLASGAHAIIVYGDSTSTSTDLKVYDVVGAGSNNETLTLLGTLVGVDATAFVAGNFIIA